MNVNQTAERLEKAAKRLGYTVESKYASTGSRYLECSFYGETMTIRVADHAECYCREDISVDPAGGATFAMAIDLLTEHRSAKLTDPAIAADWEYELECRAIDAKLNRFANQISRASKNEDWAKVEELKQARRAYEQAIK